MFRGIVFFFFFFLPPLYLNVVCGWRTSGYVTLTLRVSLPSWNKMADASLHDCTERGIHLRTDPPGRKEKAGVEHGAELGWIPAALVNWGVEAQLWVFWIKQIWWHLLSTVPFSTKAFVGLGPEENVLEEMWHVELVVRIRKPSGERRSTIVLQPVQQFCGNTCGWFVLRHLGSRVSWWSSQPWSPWTLVL